MPQPDRPKVLEVEHLTKTFRIHHERTSSLKQLIAARGRTRYDEHFALRDVTFNVFEGEALGIIGHNGSGKSTLLKCMAGIYRPNDGTVKVNRRFAALLELGAGFHPELTGRDNVYLNAAILGMTRGEITERFDEIVDFSGLEEFIDQPIKTYSSGMYVRLAFAVAINVDPDLLIIDEIMAVGDVAFQEKCMTKFAEFREQGRTIVLVTHDLGSVRDFCSRAIWLKNGNVSGRGDPAGLVDEYRETMLSSSTGPVGEFVRRGSGEIQVQRVEILSRGEATDRIQQGDPLTVRLHFRATSPQRNPVFAIGISSLNGALVTEPSSRDAEIVPSTIEGDGVVEIEIDEIPLIPGPYLLDTEVTGFGRQQIFDHLHKAARIDVLPRDNKETTGLVTLYPRWSITGDGVSADMEKFPDLG